MNAKQLKNSILQLAIQGKLVPQDPNDEPASELLKRIKKVQNARIKEGICKKTKNEPIDNNCIPFVAPESWTWVKINDIAFVTKLAGFEYTKYIAQNLKTTGVPLFKGKNVQHGNIVYEFEAYISEEISDSLVRSQINRKCLLTPYVGTIGNIAIHDKIGKFHLGSNVGKIEFFNDCENINVIEEFALFYLQSPFGYDELTKFKKATAQESISIDAIREVYIPLPPIAEQKRIVAKIEELMPLVEEYGKAREQLDKLNNSLPEALKKSILQEAIQGKLVPQDPNDEPASILLERIRKEKEQLVKEGKLKKKDIEVTSVSDDEKPFDIPESWEWCRLGSIGTWGAGATPAKGKMEYYIGGTIPWLRTGELNNGYVYDSEIKITQKALNECSLRMCDVGDVLIAMYGATIGKVAIAGIRLTTNQACCACTPVIIFNEYLMWYLLASKQTFIEMGEGGAQPNISREKIINFPFAVPPIAEQKRIVAKIEELFNVINK